MLKVECLQHVRESEKDFGGGEAGRVERFSGCIFSMDLGEGGWEEMEKKGGRGLVEKGAGDWGLLGRGR